MSLSTCIHCGGHIPLGPDATNCCESCGAFVFGKPNGPDSYQAELNELRAKLQAAEALNEEYRIQLLMADKISGDQRSRAEAAEATIKSLVDLTKYGEEMQELLSDPLMVASWIKEGIEGAHSLRDETLAENQRLQAEVARLKDGIRKIKSKVNPMVDAPIWHMANAMISEWKP